MIIKVFCPSCKKEYEVEKDQDDCTCPFCNTFLTFKQVNDYTNVELRKLMRQAAQYDNNAYSYEYAHKYYARVLELRPNSLDAFIGKLTNGLKKSTIKDTYFKQFIIDFNNQELVLDAHTYIRLGHFFETCFEILRKFEDAIVTYLSYDDSTGLNLLIYKDLLEINEIYKLIVENLNIFTDEEYMNAVFVSREDMKNEMEKIKKYINDSSIYKLAENINDTIIYSNNEKLKYSDFNLDNYSNVDDIIIFKLNYGADKYKYIFAILIILSLAMTAGLIMAFTMENKIPAYCVIFISLGLFFITYGVFLLIRKKTIKHLIK